MTNYQQVFDTLFTNSAGEKKELKQIINLDTDVFDLKDRFGNPIGKKMITIEGVTKIARFFNAQFGRPEIIDTPSKENAQGYVVLVEVSFPNGESHYEVGEANNINLKNGATGYKFTMAVKRAKSRALLKSATVALDYFLTEDEVTDNEDLQTQKQNDEDVQDSSSEKIQNNANNLKSELTVHITDFSLNSLILPASDKKYPSTSIIDILQKFDDRDYLKLLKGTYPHNKDLRNAITALSQRVGFDEKNQTNTLGEFIVEINNKLNENEEISLDLDDATTIDQPVQIIDEKLHEVIGEETTEISPSTDVNPMTVDKLDEVIIETEKKKIYVPDPEEEIFSDTEAFLASLEGVVPSPSTKIQIDVKEVTTSDYDTIVVAAPIVLNEDSLAKTLEVTSIVEPKKAKRGRPKKEKGTESMVSEPETTKKKPGRPRKLKENE